MNKQAKTILFSIFYMLGIIAFFINFTLAFSLIIITTLCYFYAVKNLFSAKLSIVFFLIFLIGFFNSAFHLKYFDDLSSYDDETINIEAKVSSIPTNNFQDKTKFYAKVLSIEEDNKLNKDINAQTLITIEDKTGEFKNIKIGDTLKLNGKVKVPQNAKNPSQFDYARYLQFKNTFSLIYVNDKNYWKITKQADDFAGKFLRKLNDKRNEIIKIHAQNIKSPMLEILGGIIFGDDAVNPDEETKTSFINSGIFHILAASGMNVTLIFGIWFFFAVRLKFNYKFSIISGILLILFYTCMTGFGPPIIRATLMLTLILIGKLIDKKTSTISLLFLVAFLMLLINPLMIFDIGFQLSFLVTFALILTSPLITFNFKFKPVNYILGACCIPIIAQLYAAPLQMFYFNTFSMYSVLANIAIIPVLSIVSFVGFISSILALIPAIASKICFIADFLLNPLLVYIVKVAEFFSNMPYSIVYLKKPYIIQILLYFTLIVSLTCILRYKKFQKKFLLLLGMIILSLFLTFIPIKNNNPEIIFFSVGNADAMLLKSTSNDYFLIDTGRLPYKKSSSQAKNIIIKYLNDKGIKRLNSVILTHFDADHAGGTIDILKTLKTNTLYLSDADENTKLSDEIKAYIAENNLNYKNITDIQNIYNKNDFTLTIIKPSGSKLETENQKSLIVHCKYKNQNILFMGDGDIESYNSLPNEYKQNIAIMKSGHHGAQNTINETMAENTDIFIISTGKNFYNHPHDNTLQIINENNKRYLRTDRHNAIKVILKDSEPEVYMYSPRVRKFVK